MANSLVCDLCGSRNIVQAQLVNVNTGEVVEHHSGSPECADCGNLEPVQAARMVDDGALRADAVEGEDW